MRVTIQLLLLAASFAGIAAAQGKIGIINIQVAIANTEDGKKALQSLESKFAPKRKEIEKRQQDIEQKKAQLQKGTTLMAEDQKRKMVGEIDSLTKVFNRDVQDASEELEQEQQKLLQDIGQKMQVVIDKYAKEKGYSIILDISNPQTPVMYAAAETEITRDIVDAYNKGAGSAPPAGTAKPPAALPGGTPAPSTATPPPPKKK